MSEKIQRKSDVVENELHETTVHILEMKGTISPTHFGFFVLSSLKKK